MKTTKLFIFIVSLLLFMQLLTVLGVAKDDLSLLNSVLNPPKGGALSSVLTTDNKDPTTSNPDTGSSELSEDPVQDPEPDDMPSSSNPDSPSGTPQLDTTPTSSPTTITNPSDSSPTKPSESTPSIINTDSGRHASVTAAQTKPVETSTPAIDCTFKDNQLSIKTSDEVKDIIVLGQTIPVSAGTATITIPESLQKTYAGDILIQAVTFYKTVSAKYVSLLTDSADKNPDVLPTYRVHDPFYVLSFLSRMLDSTN